MQNNKHALLANMGISEVSLLNCYAKLSGRLESDHLLDSFGHARALTNSKYTRIYLSSQYMLLILHLLAVRRLEARSHFLTCGHCDLNQIVRADAQEPALAPARGPYTCFSVVELVERESPPSRVEFASFRPTVITASEWRDRGAKQQPAVASCFRWIPTERGSSHLYA